jgi:molecular chaperone GrpE
MSEYPPPSIVDERGESQLPDQGAALRALRNLQATQARLERSARQDLEDERGKLVAEFLPVLDNLDRTIHAAQAVADLGEGDAALLAGVRMVRSQVAAVLHRFGVERVTAAGLRFNPALHEAISMVVVTDPALHGMVVNESEAGYAFTGKLLRPAKVVVGRLGL